MLRSEPRVRLGAVLATALLGMGLGAASAAPARVLPERALAGVRIGTRGISILQRFGEPTNIQIGNGPVDQGGAGGGFTGVATAPGLGPTPGGGPGPGSYGPTPGGGPRPYGPAALPAVGAALGAALGTSDTSGGDSSGAAQDFTSRLTTWTYRYPKQGLVLDFQLDEDGRVVQIVATGLKPNSLGRTQRGVSFGDSYSKVLKIYGFPESQSQPGSGSVVVADYRNRSRVAFQFINRKVARIVVAEM